MPILVEGPLLCSENLSLSALSVSPMYILEVKNLELRDGGGGGGSGRFSEHN